MTARQRFITGSFVTLMGLGFLLGKMAGGTLWTALGGLVWSFLVWFVGAIVGHMHCLQEAAEAVTEKSRELEAEYEGKQKLLDIQHEEIERRAKRVDAPHEGQVRAICDRVVNRILSRWVPNLSDDVRRTRVFKDVEDVLSDEFDREGLACSTEQ